MGITEFIIETATSIIESTHYVGIFVLMTLESMVAPVPSEAVMPFTGFLLFENKLSLQGIFFASSAGSLIGSWISYLFGAYAGRPIIMKFGRFLFMNQNHLEHTERFFQRYGDKTIFISRFIPVVRHVISLPAGVGRMNPFKFSLYTFFGAGLWNLFLTGMGYLLGANWQKIRQYSEILDSIVIIAIVIFMIYFIQKRKRRIPAKNL